MPAEPGLHAPRRFYGKYRGTVTNNEDAFGLGRVLVTCPAVYGTGENWAMPCSPYAGAGVGLFLLPPTGANVWVEFEAGDPDYPIASGYFWADESGPRGDVPASPAVPSTKLLKTDAISVRLDDLQGGGITVEVDSPVTTTPISITATDSGVEISMGGNKIALTPASVSINDGALEVV
jgi:hypothetical protein